MVIAVAAAKGLVNTGSTADIDIIL
ncbi:hypothetical protein A1E_02135 [Rickettsia canadensis str. McKiel]|uniref:Uncharacterized protein n=1 Tax=Rickettsia canadensis (strain McKiel) TaxID=293613 RepID=A8EYD9_RICCK|nr:hypothetical protein A1E_02135 [Rickettsia canadensis str. McKiel]